MYTSRWYKKKFFLPKKIFSFPPLFSSSSFPIPSQIPHFPHFPYPPGPVFQNFLGATPRTQPPTHPPIFVGLRPSASGLHRRAPCRFVDSGKRGKGEEEGGKREKREGESLLFTAPSQPKPASGRSKSGARSAPSPPTTYI